MEKNDTTLRFLKGLVIGTGFILPGVSGGVLAAVFGIYERFITFIAHITRDFKENVRYFLPIGLGIVAGIIISAFALVYFFRRHETQIIWFFIGGIIGTMPAFWKQAGSRGVRKAYHLVIMIVSASCLPLFLIFGKEVFGFESLPLHFVTWALGGAAISLGFIVPGLSASVLLLYFGMYAPMLEAFASLDFSVIIPIVVGGVACILLFSKLVDYILKRAYTGFYHIILGVVAVSTCMIVPLGYDYISVGGLACAIAFAAGIALGWLMVSLEK